MNEPLPYHAGKLRDMQDAAAGLERAVEVLDVRDEGLRVRAIPVQRTPSGELKDCQAINPLERTNTLTVQSGHCEMKLWSHGIPAESEVTAGEIKP